jgi:hypothetical protein
MQCLARKVLYCFQINQLLGCLQSLSLLIFITD